MKPTGTKKKMRERNRSAAGPGDASKRSAYTSSVVPGPAPAIYARRSDGTGSWAWRAGGTGFTGLAWGLDTRHGLPESTNTPKIRRMHRHTVTDASIALKAIYPHADTRFSKDMQQSHQRRPAFRDGNLHCCFGFAVLTGSRRCVPLTHPNHICAQDNNKQSGLARPAGHQGQEEEKINYFKGHLHLNPKVSPHETSPVDLASKQAPIAMPQC